MFVLCSDGLDKEVAEAEIAAIIESDDSPDLSHTLVELALSRGSRDNVTVVTIEIVGAEDAAGDFTDDESEDTVPGVFR